MHRQSAWDGAFEVPAILCLGLGEALEEFAGRELRLTRVGHALDMPKYTCLRHALGMRQACVRHGEDMQ